MNIENPKGFSMLLMVVIGQVSQVIDSHYAICALFKSIQAILLIHGMHIAPCFYFIFQ